MRLQIFPLLGQCVKEYIAELKLQETFQQQYVVSTQSLTGAQPNNCAPAEAVVILENAPWQDTGLQNSPS